jgi:hypothetical protein
MRSEGASFFSCGGRGGGLCKSKEFPDMFMMGQSNWLAAERTVNLGGTDLMNRRGE